MNKLLSSRWFTGVVSVGLAVVLWMYVHGEFQLRQTLEVNLNYISDEHRVISGPRQQTLSVEVRGPAALVRTLVTREHHLDIEAADYEPGLIIYRDFEARLHKQLPREVEVMQITPREVKFEVDSFLKKSVPINAQLQGEPAEGFSVAAVDLNPLQIWIGGARKAVEAVTQINVGPVVLTNLQTGFTRELDVKATNSDYWVLGRDQVTATIKIEEKIVQKNINVPIKMMNSQLQSVINPQDIQLVVEGPFLTVQSLAPGDFLAYVDGRDLRIGSYRRPVAIKPPTTVKLVDNNPRYFSIRIWK